MSERDVSKAVKVAEFTVAQASINEKIACLNRAYDEEFGDYYDGKAFIANVNEGARLIVREFGETEPSKIRLTS